MITVRFTKGQQRTKLAKRLFKLSRIIGKSVRFQLVVDDGRTSYIFQPKNAIEYYRAVTFFTKEEGTIAWLDKYLQSGDVFYDIGANVGLYSLYAAKLGRNITTYAFEPHKFTFVNLMENISANNLMRSIFPIAVPLSDTSDVSVMNYAHMDSGSSMSQLGHNIHPENGAFVPKLEETVYCVTLDELIAKKAVPAPHHIKIDVDGNEIKILKGMSQLLASANKPKSIQVEINPGQKAGVVAFLSGFGFRLDHSHFTANGNIKMQQGGDENEIAHNAVFVS